MNPSLPNVTILAYDPRHGDFDLVSSVTRTELPIPRVGEFIHARGKTYKVINLATDMLARTIHIYTKELESKSSMIGDILDKI